MLLLSNLMSCNVARVTSQRLGSVRSVQYTWHAQPVLPGDARGPRAYWTAAVMHCCRVAWGNRVRVKAKAKAMGESVAQDFSRCSGGLSCLVGSSTAHTRTSRNMNARAAVITL